MELLRAPNKDKSLPMLKICNTTPGGSVLFENLKNHWLGNADIRMLEFRRRSLQFHESLVR